MHLCDVEENATVLNNRFLAWTEYLSRNERRKDIARERLLQNVTDSKYRSAQSAILHFVEDHLTPQRAYHSLCERVGLCHPSGQYPDASRSAL